MNKKPNQSEAEADMLIANLKEGEVIVLPLIPLPHQSLITPSALAQLLDKETINEKQLYNRYSKGSKKKVIVFCSYCYLPKFRSVYSYSKSVNTNRIKKYCCNNIDCKNLKVSELREIQNSQGELKRGDPGYFNSWDNILFELNTYITSNNIKEQELKLDANPNIRQLVDAVERHDKFIIDALRDLGYSHNLLFMIEPKYFYNFDNVKRVVEEFIKGRNYFPSFAEIRDELRIDPRTLARSCPDGIEQLKRMLEYDERNDYIDNSGFKNRSRAEFKVAQFLWYIGIKWKREQKPFPDLNFRSDFTPTETVTYNGKLIQIEIWGISHDANDNRGKLYNQTRARKELLYQEHDYHLISIEEKDLRGSNRKVVKFLKKIFASIIDNKILSLDVPPSIFQSRNESESFPNDKLRDELMLYSIDGESLPLVETLKKNRKYYLYQKAIQRFGSYDAFALKYNLKINQKVGVWENYEEVVNSAFLKILQEEHVIKQESIIQYGRDSLYNGLMDQIRRNGGLLKAKIDFYSKYLADVIEYVSFYELYQIEQLAMKDSGNLGHQAKLIMSKVRVIEEH